jgi:serine/threonine-protein kinase
MALGIERGTIIGGTYRVIDRLGRGGMGVVLRARDEQLERDVAIKVIRPELLDDWLRQRFLSEARAMARVSHANVLPIYALGEHEGAPYFVTQVVRGQTVEKWLQGRPRGMAPDLEVAFKILEETCRGVAAIHAADTVHRDLKPSNLLLDASFSVRIADMGVAALLWSENGIDQQEIVGTPEYMAPEVVEQLKLPPELAPRIDVYAIGCLAFELFTGTTPFPARSVIGKMTAHVKDPRPRPSSRRPELPPEVDDLVLAAMAINPRERTCSAEAFLRALVATRAKVAEPVRILVADDDEDFREIFGMMLRSEFPDAAVECVADGEAAVEAFDRRRPSVAIVDLRMPKIGGSEVTELLRSRRSAQSVPIVVLTGSGGPAEWRRLAALGADGFLVKPVNIKDVATILRRVLAERVRITPVPDAAPDPEAETVHVGRMAIA